MANATGFGNTDTASTEVAGHNSVWEVNDTYQSGEIWWKIAADAKIPPPTNTNEAFVPFPLELKNFTPVWKKGSGLLPLSTWNDLRRRLGDDEPEQPKNWNRVSDDLRFVQVRKVDNPLATATVGLKGISWEKNQPPGDCWTDFWDLLFNDSMDHWHDIATRISSASPPMWQQVVIPKWERRDIHKGGKYTLGKSDERFFDMKTDGVGFCPLALSNVTVPDQTAYYVKLSYAGGESGNGAAVALTRADPRCAEKALRFSQVYIGETTLGELCNEKYKWEDNMDMIATRNAKGEVVYIEVPPEVRQRSIKDTWWKVAKKNSLKEIQGHPVRSRNATLKLHLVPHPSDGSGLEEHQDFVDTVELAVAKTVVSIKQGYGIHQNGEDMSKYHLLGRNPFGFYDTYISDSDWCAYLEGYPGYHLPSKWELVNVTKKMEEFANATGRKSYQTDIDQLAAELKKSSVTQYSWPRQKADWVTFETIATAVGARTGSEIPSQQSQVGGSATGVAQAANWIAPAQRVAKWARPGGGPAWDAPGVYPAEWLHRSAFSFGNPRGNPVSQDVSNFVFGSSEANSLMTRYERAWQLFFVLEHQIATARKKASQVPAPPATGMKGRLWTINTADDKPLHEFLPPDAKAGTKASEVRETTKNKSDRDDLWQAVEKWQNLSFRLDYQLVCDLTKIAQTLRPPLETTFYPFERGFFTRLEADVDVLLLTQWADLHKGAVQPQQPQSPPQVQPQPKLRKGMAIRLKANADSVALPTVGDGQPPQEPEAIEYEPTYAQLWKAAVQGEPIIVGGVNLRGVGAIVEDRKSLVMWHVPFPVTGPDGGRRIGLKPEGDNKPRVIERPPIDLSLLDGLDTSDTSVPENEDGLTPILRKGPQPDHDNIPTAPEDDRGQLSSATVPDGFILSGTVKLFGLFEAPLYISCDPSDGSMTQIITLADDLSLGTLIPTLRGTDFDALQLKNTCLRYTDRTTATDIAGTWLQTDMAFSGPLQVVSDFLTDVCGQEDPRLQIQVFLSQGNNWSRPLNCDSLMLRGSIPEVRIPLGPLGEITELGIGVGIRRGMEASPPYKTAWKHSIQIWGRMNLHMPKDMAPLQLGFSAMEQDGVLVLAADAGDGGGDSGLGFAGIEGLRLSHLSLSTSIAIKMAPKLVGFFAEAQIVVGDDTTVALSGFYAGQAWGFEGRIANLDFGDLSGMYERLFGAKLHNPLHEVVLEELAFCAGPDGITLSGRAVVEGSYTAARATVALSRRGINITGDVDNIRLDDVVTLKHAGLDIFVNREGDTSPGTTGKGTSWRFAITGTVELADTTISASLFLDKDAQTKQLLWTVYGGFAGHLQLSNLAPALKGTFLDLELHNAAFIASNADGTAASGATIPSAFTVKKGVQVAASIGPIAALDNSLNNPSGPPTTGLTLSLAYLSGGNFEIAIQLATPRKIDMAKKSCRVASGPVSLAIQLLSAEEPRLLLTADFFVLPPSQPSPLKFTGGIAITPLKASLFIEMKSQWWTNPLGLSPLLRIGPDLALEIAIIYAAFPWYPSQLALSGGLAFGKATGHAALSYSESPTDELILAEVGDLDVRDLVAFASLLAGEDLLQGQQLPDFLRLEKMKLYMSTGVTIGTKIYPPGASFDCAAVVCGHEARVSGSVSKGSGVVSIEGAVDAFRVGPLAVGGYESGTPAVVKIEMGPVRQTFVVSGGVLVFGDYRARVRVDVGLLPEMKLLLGVEVEFANSLSFQLEGRMQGPALTGTNVEELARLDFDLHARMEQDIVGWIVDRVTKQIGAAVENAKKGIDVAQRELDEKEKGYLDGIVRAEAAVAAAKGVFDERLKGASDKLAEKEREVEQKTQELKTALGEAERKFEDAVGKARAALQHAEDRRVEVMREAQDECSKAEKEADDMLDKANDELHRAHEDMDRRFGDAINKINHAQTKVDDATANLKGLKNKYKSAKANRDRADKRKDYIAKAYWDGVMATLNGLIHTASAFLRLATSSLDAAKAVINTPGYILAQTTLTTAETTLSTAQSTATSILSTAHSTLQSVAAGQAAIIKEAQSFLDATLTRGVEKLTFDTAKQALDTFAATVVAVLSGLRSAVSQSYYGVEAVAFRSAKNTLLLAEWNVREVNIARAALDLAREWADDVGEVARWVENHQGEVLQVKGVEVWGALRAACVQKGYLDVRVWGTFAGEEVDVKIELTPKKGEEFVKRLVGRLLEGLRRGRLGVAV